MIKNDIANINTVVNFKSSANISYQVRYKEYTGTAAIMKAKDKEVYGCGLWGFGEIPPTAIHVSSSRPGACVFVFSCFRVLGRMAGARLCFRVLGPSGPSQPLSVRQLSGPCRTAVLPPVEPLSFSLSLQLLFFMEHTILLSFLLRV